jgi:hypothetical protein
MTSRGPSPAERARTALAGTSVASLITHGCPGARTLTVVSVQDGPRGNPVLWLDRDSPVVRLLGTRRVVSLRVPAPVPHRWLELTGPLESARIARPGRRAYRLSVLSARFVGATTVSVPVGDFADAEPDPLAGAAAAVLQHLGQAHADELLACLRSHGLRDVLAVVPDALDRYGISLVALCADGVRTLRLDFPNGPVDRLEDVAPGLRAPLTCRCSEDDRA